MNAKVISIYAADTSGVCSALYELGGMTVVHDVSGHNLLSFILRALYHKPMKEHIYFLIRLIGLSDVIIKQKSLHLIHTHLKNTFVIHQNTFYNQSSKEFNADILYP